MERGLPGAGSGENALRYLSRYVFKTATSNRAVQLLPEGKLLWTYPAAKVRANRVRALLRQKPDNPCFIPNVRHDRVLAAEFRSCKKAP